MYTLSSLLNSFDIAPKPTLGAMPSVPFVQPSKFSKALVKSKRLHVVRTAPGSLNGGQPISVDVFEIDHRALERNKYAPWGRGHASGLA